MFSEEVGIEEGDVQPEEEEKLRRVIYSQRRMRN